MYKEKLNLGKAKNTIKKHSRHTCETVR